MKKKTEEAHEAKVPCTGKRHPKRKLRSMQFEQGARYAFECINCGCTISSIVVGVGQAEPEEPECEEVPFLCPSCGELFTARCDPVRIS
jgi:predicted RNA-binding Zn-ribbon protein involved in translation (DUF1610 family)